MQPIFCSNVSHEVTLGVVDRDNPPAGHVQISASQFFAHESYDKNTLLYDIALLKLPSAVTLTGYLNPFFV